MKVENYSLVYSKEPCGFSNHLEPIAEAIAQIREGHQLKFKSHSSEFVKQIQDTLTKLDFKVEIYSSNGNIFVKLEGRTFRNNI